MPCIKIKNIFHFSLRLNGLCQMMYYHWGEHVTIKNSLGVLAPVGEFLGLVSETLTKLFIERRRHAQCAQHLKELHLSKHCVYEF